MWGKPMNAYKWIVINCAFIDIYILPSSFCLCLAVSCSLGCPWVSSLAETDLGLLLLPLPVYGWDYTNVPPCLVYVVLENKCRAPCLLDKYSPAKLHPSPEFWYISTFWFVLVLFFFVFLLPFLDVTELTLWPDIILQFHGKRTNRQWIYS